ALAAALAPGSAVALLGRLSGPGAGEALALAEALARRSRAERLAALASALSAVRRRDGDFTAARGERPPPARAAGAPARPGAGSARGSLLRRLLGLRPCERADG